jgi:molecular chaperone DnaK
VHISPGEASMAEDNISLRKLLLTDIPPAPRAVSQIDVLFEIDVDGILTVSVKDILLWQFNRRCCGGHNTFY